MAPGSLKTIGIQAGAPSRIQVSAPGEASKNRAPNWRRACSQTGEGGCASITDMARLWAGNTGGVWGLVFDMKNLQHFDAPNFEADVLNAEQPVVVDFTAVWCPPCQMMAPVVERLADEFAGRVKIGKLDVDNNQELAIRYGVQGIPTLGLFREGKLVDRLVGFPGGAAPIREWIEKTADVTTLKK